MRAAATISLLLMLTACVDDGLVTTTDDEAPGTTTAPTSTVPPVVECPGEGRFEEGGGIAEFEGVGSDSARLGRISWTASDRCETFVFEFETSEGAPATSTPDVRVEHLDSLQVIRVHLGVDVSVVADQVVETGLVSRIYVVRALDGGVFVDIHLTAPAAARAAAGASPARLGLELRPGFVEFAGSVAASEDVVIVSPWPDAQVPTDVELSGYTRSEAPQALVVVTQSGALVSETNAPTAETTDLWREFSLDLALPPGPVSVFAGQAGPEDGALEGLTIDLEVS